MSDETPLNVYYAKHAGIVVYGHSVIVAKDEQQARELLMKAMVDHGINGEFTEARGDYIRKLNASQPKCFVIDDGDE